MTPSRLIRVFAVLLLFVVPSFAFAATTEFRVLFDVDNDDATGCTVNGMGGVDQVLITQITDGTPAKVTRVQRQSCIGTMLGSMTDIDSPPWNAGWNAATKLLTFETRIPFSAFGPAEMPTDIHAGFDGSRNGGLHTSIANADGTPIMVPQGPVRRRAIAALRHITLNGELSDWGDIKPAVIGLASNGNQNIRLLRILAWADPNDDHLYFAATAYLGSDYPYADDDIYLRPTANQSLAVNAASGVLDNDAIPGNAPLSAQQVSEPKRGTVTLNADGSFTYSPTHPQLVADDEFEYKATGGGKESNVARVIIRTGNPNENPNAPEDDEYDTREDQTLVVPNPGVLENDDPNDNVLVATLFTGPSHGTVVLNPDGGFTYKPASNYFGPDMFVYTASKKQGAPEGIGGNATVTITVKPVNDPPSFSPGPSPVTVIVGSGPYAQGWATNISPGPPNESGQAVNFAVFNDNNGLFTVQPAISPSGVLTFTPGSLPGSATVSVQLEDNGGTANGGVDTSPLVQFTINVTCGATMTVTNPANANGTAGSPFSETFTQSGGVGTTTFSLNSGTLPAGLTLAPNGVLSGTPTQTGSFPITVRATDSNGCFGIGPPYTIVIGCQTITVTNPANANGTASSPFSETFLQSGGIGATTFSLNSGTLPAGLTLAANGTLSGTPTQTGSFPITVRATDSNGCQGIGATYTIVIGCQTITVTNPATTTGTASSPFSQTFTQTGAIGTATFTTASTLPAGLTLAANGTLSGTPTQTGSFPIVVTVTDSNGCTGTGATYTLVIGCQTITVTNPATTTGTVSSPFSQTFTQSGAVGGATFTLNSGVLPAGLTLAANGTLSGTPTEDGSFPITVLVTDGNSCTGVSATYNLVIACQTITVTNPANATGPAGSPFSETFTQTGAVGGATFTTASTLPAGLSLSTAGVLSGIPTQTGTFPIVVTVTDGNGCTGVSATYNLVITCQTITVTNPANTNGTASSPFSETFTQTGAIGTATFTTASTLPAGLSLSTAGVLSGTPTQTGTFPIVVTVTDSNGCTGTSATYNLVIGCQTITVTNPANANGTAASSFSETFTQTGGIGTTTFSLASGTLPAGLTLAANGVLSGTPIQTGSFPITVTATDSNGCTGTGTTYTIIIGCQTITVNNPANTSGTVSAPFSETFTQTGGILPVTFTTASTLPTGLTLSTAGVLSGTPTQTGTFPITVTVTDANSCTGTSATYNLTIGCQTITVTNPVNTGGTVSAGFSETFTQTGAVGGATFTLNSGVLPNGLTLATNGTLSGTPIEDGSFPITVLVTDGNGCTGVSATYNLVIACQIITVTNPVNTTGPAGTPFSETFTQIGGILPVTFTTASTLPTGLSLSTAGVLSGTPTQGGTFPITVTVTDANGCTGTSPVYILTITCPVITVTNPVNGNGTASSPFSETFTASGGIPAYTFSLASGTLPAGLSLAANGVLSGTPTQTGSFQITVTATDSNNCTGTGTTYTINIACQVITVTNPANGNGTASSPFSETFTQSGGIGTTTFSIASGTLPAGLSLAANGVLSGTPTQTGSFQITVTATDSNNCTGTGTTYTITIACQIITVNNPANANGTVNAPFSETFTQVGAIGTATFTTASTLPAGITLATNGTLSGTPTQSGSFPIVVTVTDSNGCTVTSATYNLNIACQTITVNVPGVNTGTAGTPFSQTFTQNFGILPVSFTTASTLPAGLVLQTDGTLTGTPTSVGTFPIVVTVTDANGCTGTGATYNLVIDCQIITVTNPATTSVQAGTTLGAAYTFTATGILGTANWSLESGTLPVGITLNATSGQLQGSSTAQGSYPITVRVTDTNGCFDISDTYTLDVVCPVIGVARTGGGTFPAGTFNSAYTGESFTGSGGTGPYTFAVTGGTFPTGLTLASNGTISGTPTQTGTFIFTVTATDASLCPGSQSFTIAINPFADPDTYSNLVNNTQAVVTGTTTAPATPHVVLSGLLITDDLPSGGVVAVAQTIGTTQGGSVTIAADGSFLYTPPVTVNALATDSFTYTISSNTGATGTPTTAGALVTLNLANRVWYVRNDGPNGDGRSHSPFNSTSNFVNGARVGPDKPSDFIYIYRGDGTTTNLATGVVLLDNEQLIGQGVVLLVNTHTLMGAGLAPQLTNTTPGDVIVLGNGNTVRGLTTTGGTNGISGASKTAFTGGNLTLQNATSSGLVLSTFAGAVTLTNTTITNNAIGVNLAAGTLAFTMDNTNSITANAGQRSINFNALGATAVVAVGAPITDNGLGIAVSNSVAGAAISFTGTQTLSTGGNIAVNLTTNTGAAITFGGALGVTTTTGSGFTATGGGTLEVGAGASTANITTGAAGTASVNITGMTIGVGGVTFDSVNATGPSTGVNVVNNNGTVSVNGGTINNAGNGAHMQGATTSLSLAGVTIGGTTTTGINTTTNFGTLTIGASVNVSAATALNLNTGAVSGMFNNVTSTGGTNGVNLNAVTGTWGATAGALSGASGATFNVTGGNANITWGPTVSQANAANVVTIATSNSGIINFNGNVSSTGTSTGLSISGSSGTYNFNGATNTFSGAGGITIGPSESGTVTFSNGSTITTAGTAFNVAGGGGAVTAAITYSGTINKASAGILIAVDNLDAPGTLTMTHAPAAAGNLTQNNNGANGISVINSSSTNITISNASVTFNNVAAGFTASGNTGGTINLPGLFLDGNGTKAGMLISGAGTINVNAGAANPTIDLSGGTNAASKAIDGTATSFTGTLNLTNATITGNATANADIVSLTGSTLGGSGSTISGANRALVLSGVALTNGADMTSVTSSGGANGISLTNVTGGPYTIGGGSLTGNTGASFLVSGGTRTITYAGSITQSTAAQRAVDIQTSTGGTINFTGTITSTGAGIFANNNGGTTMSYRGGVSLTTTTNAGFTATAGGTVEVCDENPCDAAATGALVNTITTTTGTSLNVANTTISANNLEFRSISANGAASGIILNTTLALGRLRVNGVAAAASGGTIQATTGDAISLTSTQSPSFNLMSITNTGGQGLNATTLTAGFTVTNSTFSQTGNGDNEHAMRLFDISGTVSIQNTSFNNTAEDFINIDSSTNLSQMTLNIGTTTACTFTQPNTLAAIRAAGAFAGSGILVQHRGTKNYTINLSNSTFTDIKLTGIQVGSSASTSTATNVNVNIDNNDFLVTIVNSLGNPNNRSNHINIQALNTLDIDASITNNLLDNGGGGGIQLGADNSANLNANITGNTVSDQFADGILIGVDESASLTVLIDTNIITNTSSDGMELSNGISPGGTSILNATITNNTVTGHNNNAGANSFVGGIAIFGAVEAADQTNIDIRSNNVSGNPNPGVFFDYYTQGFGDNIQIEGPGLAAVTEPAFLTPGTLANVSGSPPAGRTFLADVFFNNNTNVTLPVLTP